jgi:hypothetical protein
MTYYKCPECSALYPTPPKQGQECEECGCLIYDAPVWDPNAHDAQVFFPAGERLERPFRKFGFHWRDLMDWCNVRGYEIVTYRADTGRAPERNQVWAKVLVPAPAK